MNVSRIGVWFGDWLRVMLQMLLLLPKLGHYNYS